MDKEHLNILEAMQSNVWSGTNAVLPFVLGADENGNLIVKDFAVLPHLVIAGATGTGKSTLAHAVLLSLISRQSPKSIGLVLCDTKIIEFSGYKGLPHLLVPTVTDLHKVTRVLRWLTAEIRRRALVLQEASARSISSYNENATDICKEKMQHIVAVIDDAAIIAADSEASDLLQVILENGRSVGIHLLLITQSPANKNIATHIKAIPARAVFNVFTNTEEKLLLGTAKNKHLSDVGEIIFCNFLTQEMQRLKCLAINDNDISIVVSKAKGLYGCRSEYPEGIMEEASTSPQDNTTATEPDEMLPAAVDLILETGQASVSMLQRRLKLGYARAARIVDEMEAQGIVGPFLGSTPRAILVTREQWRAMRSGGSSSILNTISEVPKENDQTNCPECTEASNHSDQSLQTLYDNVAAVVVSSVDETVEGEMPCNKTVIDEAPSVEVSVDEVADTSELQDKPRPIRWLLKFFRKESQ